MNDCFDDALGEPSDDDETDNNEPKEDAASEPASNVASERAPTIPDSDSEDVANVASQSASSTCGLTAKTVVPAAKAVKATPKPSTKRKRQEIHLMPVDGGKRSELQCIFMEQTKKLFIPVLLWNQYTAKHDMGFQRKQMACCEQPRKLGGAHMQPCQQVQCSKLGEAFL